MKEEDLLTGIGIVDSQHQTFLTILKKIKNCNYRDNPDDLTVLIDELHLYTLYHFETEERILTKNNSPNLEEHRLKHAELSEKIEEYRIENMTDACLLSESMADFLENWLFQHIINTDKIDLKIIRENEDSCLDV